MTSSSSCAPSPSRRRARAALVALALVLLPGMALGGGVDAVRGADIEQAWFRVVQTLDPIRRDQLRERCDDLLQVARKAEIRRLTPMALALAVRSRSLPPAEARIVLEQAARLDPASAEVAFAQASLSFRARSPLNLVRSLARGVVALAVDPRLEHIVRPGLLLTAVVAFLAVFVMWAILAIRRVLPPLWHDLIELGGSWRMGPNAGVLAVLVLGLPLFTGLDPVWLLLWLVALAVAYLPGAHKAFGLAGLLGIVAAPTLLETGFSALTHPPNAVEQAAIMLTQDSFEPHTTDELSALADLFGDEPDFRRLQGDCYRQMRMTDAAAWAYREGLRLAPTNARLALGLGSVHFMESDFNSALQAFQAARDAGGDPVIVNYNLSLTLAQTYHFPESDSAIAAARAAGASRLAKLTRVRSNQILMPVFSRDEARELLARKDPVLLLNRGLVVPPLVWERSLLHPVTIGALLLLVLAGAHYLIRQRTTGFAGSCQKCGRAFCRRCRLAHESQSYCTQCVNIFLKKDMVAIEAQLAKRAQLKRHFTWLRIERRASDVLLPGLGLAFAGRTVVGGGLAVLAAVSAAIALVWLPRFVAPALLDVSVLPLQIVAGLVWAGTFVAAQLVDVERR